MKRVVVFTLFLLVCPLCTDAQGRGPTLRDVAREKGFAWTTFHSESLFLNSLDQLITRSDVIVLGRVVNERARLSSDERKVVTDYTLEVTSAIKDALGVAPEGGQLVISKVGGNVLVDGKPVRMDTPNSPPVPWIQSHLFFIAKSETDGGLYIGSMDSGPFPLANGRVVCNSRQSTDPATKEICGKVESEAVRVLRDKAELRQE